MKQSVIKYGICADNNDPWGVGRIRVIIDTDMVPPLRTGVNIQNYLNKLDSDNQKTNPEYGYIPWELGVSPRSPDPFVFDPFLPKHLNLIPKVGESVKIIYYVLDNESQQREYVGQHTSNYDKLQYDSGESARSFTKLSQFFPKKNNLRTDGLIPDVNDVAFMGRSNSELVLPEQEAILRAGHQDFFNGVKNNRNALIQLSHFLTRKNVITETKTENASKIVPINRVVEYNISFADKLVDPLYIFLKLYIYPVANMDTKNYNSYIDYYSNVASPEFLIEIHSNTPENIISFVQTILTNFDKNNINLDVSNGANFTGIEIIPDNNQNIRYSVYDYRTIEGGEPNFYPLNLYQLRAYPKIDLSIEENKTIVNGLGAELRPLSKRPTQQYTTSTNDNTVDDPNTDETIVVEGADKLFLLTWNSAKALQNKMGKYGFSQNEIYLTLQQNTEPMVRGNLLLNLILELLNLFERHGHIASIDPIGSLNYDAVNKIQEIKDKYSLLSKVNKDLTGGSNILNQYLRLN
jgi:hypothetical protein